MKNQIKWSATLANGEQTHVYTSPGASEQEARAKLAELMKDARVNLILDTSLSRVPSVLEGERQSAVNRDYAGLIASIRPCD